MGSCNFNLLGATELARLGLNAEEIALVEANRPFDSVLDLALLPGFPFEKVRRLFAQGFAAGSADLAMLAAPTGGAVDLLELAMKDEEEDGQPDRTATLDDGSNYRMDAPGPNVTINDCVSKVTIRITAESPNIDRQPGESENQQMARAQGMAARALGLALFKIVLQSRCTDPACKNTSTTLGELRRLIAKVGGTQKLRAIFKLPVTIACTP